MIISRPSRRKKYILSGILIIFALTLATPFLFGRYAHHSLQQGTEQLLTHTGWQISSEVRKRGWLSSELAHLISPLNQTLTQKSTDLSGDVVDQQSAFVVQHKLKHGPFLGLFTDQFKLGMALIESSVSLSQGEIDRPIPAVIHTAVMTPGRVKLNANLAAGSLELQQQIIRWGDGRLTLRLDKHDKLNFELDQDSFENEILTSRTLIGPTRATGTLTLLDSGLWLGETSIVSDGILLVDADQSLRTDDIRAKITGTRNDDQHIDYDFKAEYAQEDLIGGFYGKNKLAFTLKHVSELAVANLGAWLQQSSPDIGELLSALDLLVSEQPELTVSVDMVSNHGPIRVNAVASLTATEQAPVGLFGLSKNLIAIFDVETTEHWLNEYDIFSQPEVANLIANNDITADEQGVYRLRGKYIGGQAYLNDSQVPAALFASTLKLTPLTETPPGLVELPAAF